ncbi:baseplate J/gp47 family protein [Ralstonia syzygii subsp. celebesensis]|uniref:Baseplate protein n=2 Tax=Ralstonia syzygii subsp. celebesensis TaxID=1310168 RepID=A0A1U9VD77_9RALS|nr:baseplate J/gp47 family protein [Ralstonia syzygii]AQW28634.1 baseplate protein [blood disease bacterium A2-HR MARDI]CCA82196.1 putative phage baseplate protein [blood disease bacterium R229]
MAINAKDFQTLVREQVAAIQGGTSKVLVDLSVGSILRSVVEAYSAVALWLQGLILQLLATTRAATSSGTDLDSWVADYGLTRLPASPASGVVTFSRFTPTQQAVVPVGAIVQTADGTQQYAVTVDTTNPAYSASQGGYVMAAGNASVNAPVVAVSVGAAGNASVNGVNTLGQAIPGVDTVTNAAAFTNGTNAESDAALRTRFIAYVASLSKATKAAVGYAATSLKQGLTYTLVENQQYNGTAQNGYFYLVVDDGTGYPSSTFLATVYNAIDAVRPLTSTFGVFAPVVLAANVGMTITTAAGYDHIATASLVAAALTSYINSLPLGTPLAWSRLAQVAYDASPGVTNVSAVLLNGATADIATTNQQVVKAGTVSVA